MRFFRSLFSLRRRSRLCSCCSCSAEAATIIRHTPLSSAPCCTSRSMPALKSVLAWTSLVSTESIHLSPVKRQISFHARHHETLADTDSTYFFIKEFSADCMPSRVFSVNFCTRFLVSSSSASRFESMESRSFSLLSSVSVCEIRQPACNFTTRASKWHTKAAHKHVPMCFRMFFISVFPSGASAPGAWSASVWADVNLPFSSRGTWGSFRVVSATDMKEGFLNTSCVIW